jgi:hypothetical protein
MAFIVRRIVREVGEETFTTVLPKVLIWRGIVSRGYRKVRSRRPEAYIEVAEVDCPEVEEHSNAEQGVRRFFESAPVDQRAGFARRQAHSGDRDDDD